MIAIKELCPGCGLCVPVCPTGALAVTAGRAALTGECVDCGLCVPACPVGAIGVAQASTPPSPSPSPSPSPAAAEESATNTKRRVKDAAP